MSGRVSRLSAAAVVGIAGLVVFPGALRAQEPDARFYTLERAIVTALEHSQNISQADARVHSAGQQVREAWGEVLPTIAGDAQYARNIKVPEAFLPAIIFDPTAPPDLLVPVRFGSDNTWTAGIRLDQKLFEMKAFIGLGAAGRFRQVEAERRRGTVQQVVTAVRRAYLDALLAREQLRLVGQSIDRTRKSLEETRGLNRAGLASEYDVLRLEVQLGNLEPNLRRARNARDAADRNLLVATGLAPTTRLELEGNLSTLDVEHPAANDPANARLLKLAGGTVETRGDTAALLATALERRSDLREVRLSASLERSRLAADRSEFFPTVALFGDYRVTAQENGSPTFFGDSQSRTTFADVGVRVEIPIFQGFKRAARAQQTAANIDQLRYQEDLLQQQARSELETVVADLDEARERAIAQRHAVAQAQRGFDIASIQYREGLGSQLQITDSEVALRQSEFNYADAVYDYLLARARLDAAVGTVPDTPEALATRLAGR